MLKSVRETAELLSLSELTVRKLMATGRITFTRIGRAVRVPESEIDRLVRESTVGRKQ